MSLCLWLLLSCWFFFAYDEYKTAWLVDISVYIYGIFLILFMTFLGAFYTIEYESTIESVPMDYKLKEPLEINVNYDDKPKIKATKDSNGLKIISIDNMNNVAEKISFNKGDVVKIKTVEKYDIFGKRDERDWKNASVFVIYEDKLLELSRGDIKKQGIDTFLKEIYKEQ